MQELVDLWWHAPRGSEVQPTWHSGLVQPVHRNTSAAEGGRITLMGISWPAGACGKSVGRADARGHFFACMRQTHGMPMHA